MSRTWKAAPPSIVTATASSCLLYTSLCRKEELEGCFREFAPYLGKCQFTGCSHVKEKGCAVLKLSLIHI